MYLVVGVGNRGTEYQDNRHNRGFKVVDELSARARGNTPRAKFGAEIGEVTLAGARVLLCKPMEFMNVSGQAVARVAGFWKVPVADLIVVHDELDLPFGRLKLGVGGGHGGHNGVRSLLADLGAAGFARVRVGAGRKREYETSYILRPDSTTDVISQVNLKVRGVIEAGGGTLLKVDNWGKRKLAYEVKKQLKGIYLFFSYLGTAGLVEEVERNLRLTDSVMRYYSVKIAENVDPGARTSDCPEEAFAKAATPGPDAA